MWSGNGILKSGSAQKVEAISLTKKRQKHKMKTMESRECQNAEIEIVEFRVNAA